MRLPVAEYYQPSQRKRYSRCRDCAMDVNQNLIGRMDFGVQVKMIEHNHPIPDKYVESEITRQQIMDEFVAMLIPNPENYYNNWPPPSRPTDDEIRKNCAESDVLKWLCSLQESDQIKRFADNTPLAGCGGYVAFRDGKQVSHYETWIS